jgi:uncharacterized protein YcbX
VNAQPYARAVNPWRVCALQSTPVKGLRILPREELVLDRDGAADDRRFYVIDERANMVNGKQIGVLCAVVAQYDMGTLTLAFPDRTVTGTVALGAEIATRFFSRPAPARIVEGPWSEALSEHAGRALRLVTGRRGVDRGRAGGVTLISRATVDRLAEVAHDAVDARRFRTLIELAGPRAHVEDAWVGRRLRVGEAVIGVGGHVGRCLVTTRDPDSGEVDLPVLDLLRSYRAGATTTEPLALGVYGEVLAPGRVRLGDAAELL